MASSSAQMVASVPLLATKLYIPKWRPGLVSRPRLIALLEQGSSRKLTLVSAPAGFGKTMVLAEWLAPVRASAPVAAWVSLHRGDNDPTLFWAYVISALQTIRSGIGANARSLLQSPQPPPIESVLTSLINEITEIEEDFALVLDDFHMIDAPSVHHAIAFLLDHLPPSMHLVITTREDPRLPLARLRAQDQLTELRAVDLRFTSDEAAAFLNDTMGLDLSAHDVAALETRTEGWIAGLQLAALSIRGRDDVSGFIHAFTGDDRYIVDYLIEEVLHRQSERIRSFLLQTSILSRLSGPLCDFVTGRDDSQELLASLERGNLFVVSLDDKRHWYRYHHLFADVLRTYAVEEEPEQVAVRRQRASEWYERQGLLGDAVRHALAAEDFARAARLIEVAAPAMNQGRQEATLLGWLKALPDELVHNRPVLSVVYAGAILSNGAIEGAEDRLRDAERWLEPADDTSERDISSPSEMVVVDQDEYRRLPGSVAVYRAGIALAMGKLADTLHYARRALELAPLDDDLHRGAAAAILGLASWTIGDLEAAHRSYADGMASLLRAGHVADAIGGTLALADIRIAQGRLHEAMSTYEQALRLASEPGASVLRGTADMYVGMSELHRERNDLDAATQLLLRSAELGESAGFPQNPYRWHMAMARIREAQGDLAGALDLLNEAERLYVSDFYPNVRPLEALKTRVWLAQGKVPEAIDWARARQLAVDDDLSYLREFEHVTLAKVLIARFRSDRDDDALRGALSLLERLLDAARVGGRMGGVIEILVQQALAFEAKGDRSDALVSLTHALALAESEGYVRLFTSEGAPMAHLLAEATTQGIMPGYAGSLLASFGAVAPASATALSYPPTQNAQSLVEPLSPRELEVLRLIAEGLSNQEISERLFLALSTVKGHNRLIFDKLQVQRRTEAVARARELGLL